MINYEDYFKNVFLPSLETLFDTEWQLKGWGGLDDPAKYIGFDEVTMQFSETCEVVLSAPHQYNLSKKQEQFLKELYNMIDTYDCQKNRSNDEREIIKDPRWHRIREFAKVVHDDLKHVIFKPKPM